MRRIKLVLAMAAVLVGMLAILPGPAMADELNCRDARGDLIRCGGDLYSPYDNDGYSFYNDSHYNYFSPFVFFNPYYSPYYYNDCGYDWGGPVNPYDC